MTTHLILAATNEKGQCDLPPCITKLPLASSSSYPVVASLGGKSMDEDDPVLVIGLTTIDTRSIKSSCPIRG